MKKLIKRLVKFGNTGRDYSAPLININLSKSALLNNLNEFRDIASNGQVAPVLKSNAYGHGLSLIAGVLEYEKVPLFVIDSYFEAKALRNDRIKTPLLIIGYSSIDSISKNNLKSISFTLTSLESLKALAEKIKKKTFIHLKIDTGMNRQGILSEEIDEAIKIIKDNKEIILEGICSHLSDADNPDEIFTKKQIVEWNKGVKYFRQQFPALKYWHISNSAGHIYTEADSNMTRLGIGLYGLTNIKDLNLKPVFEMRTIITGVKKINKGESVGYNNTYMADKDMMIATIPVGYNEGVDRRLSNKGSVKVSDIQCPIIGRVSMNITIVDISKVNKAKIGDEVIVFSSNKNDANSLENVANICDTISCEIAVHIPAQLKRVLVK